MSLLDKIGDVEETLTNISYSSQVTVATTLFYSPKKKKSPLWRSHKNI